MLIEQIVELQLRGPGAQWPNMHSDRQADRHLLLLTVTIHTQKRKGENNL